MQRPDSLTSACASAAQTPTLPRDVQVLDDYEGREYRDYRQRGDKRGGCPDSGDCCYKHPDVRSRGRAAAANTRCWYHERGSRPAQRWSPS